MQKKSLFPNFLIYICSAPAGAHFNSVLKKGDTKKTSSVHSLLLKWRLKLGQSSKMKLNVKMLFLCISFPVSILNIGCRSQSKYTSALHCKLT